MNPIKFLNFFTIGLLQKYNLYNLLIGAKQIVRIDLFKGNTSPNAIKLFLLANGFAYADLPVSDRPGHIAGLAVSKDPTLLQQLTLAIGMNDQEVIKVLLGEQLVLTDSKKIETLKDVAPPLYDQFKEHQFVA